MKELEKEQCAKFESVLTEILQFNNFEVQHIDFNQFLTPKNVLLFCPIGKRKGSSQIKMCD